MGAASMRGAGAASAPPVTACESSRADCAGDESEQAENAATAKKTDEADAQHFFRRLNCAKHFRTLPDSESAFPRSPLV